MAEFAPSHPAVFNWTFMCEDDIAMAGNIILMDKSAYIWVGEAGAVPKMGSLITAVTTKYDPMPLSTTLIGIIYIVPLRTKFF